MMGNITKITDKQKKTQGSARYIKNTPHTRPISTLWPAPAELKPIGREFYEAVGQTLVAAKVLTELDRHTFTVLARAFQQLADMQAVLDREGYTVTKCNGDGLITDERRHPALLGYKEALNAYMNLASRFGLTPYDRRRIDLPVDENTNDATRRFFQL